MTYIKASLLAISQALTAGLVINTRGNDGGIPPICFEIPSEAKMPCTARTTWLLGIVV